jgi:hypothetical protein
VCQRYVGTGVSFLSGRDGSEASNADGSVLKVNCDSGYELNMAKKKVRCKRGDWKPDLVAILRIIFSDKVFIILSDKVFIILSDKVFIILSDKVFIIFSDKVFIIFLVIELHTDDA